MKIYRNVNNNNNKKNKNLLVNTKNTHTQKAITLLSRLYEKYLVLKVWSKI